MTDFRAPSTEIFSLLRHAADLDGVLALPAFAGVDEATVEGLVAEAGRFFEEVLAPLNRDSDVVGTVRRDDGGVSTAPGFADAYRRMVDAGWMSIGGPVAYGGGGFPSVVNLAVHDLMASACLSFSLCPTLTGGSIDALSEFGTEEQREVYLPRLISAEWSGTMNMTEPEAGSDVGALTTRALPNDDGSWRITGQKIFISWGEHDMADNIVHMVLARTPDSPPGTKGISLFLVPKYLVGDDGTLGEHNDVRCVSLEHKLGLHGSPTAVMAFGDEGGATGWLVGEEHGGMRAMFAMMNSARLAVGLEGVAIAERAYQQALAFAHERRQGQAPGAEPGSPSPIVEHPDVQRMLLDMASCIAAMRGLCYRTAAASDRTDHAETADQRRAGDHRAALFTPLAKAWCTDLACELTSTGIQIHGGMGYVEETGAAQHFREARITPIYEGTNGIQAIDLVSRKVPLDDGAAVRAHLAEMRSVATAAAASPTLGGVAGHLTSALDAVEEATAWMLAASPVDRLPGATAYLEMLAVATGGSILIDTALSAADADDGQEAERRATLARFFAMNRLAAVVGRRPAVEGLGAVLADGRTTVLAP
ncbi:MAG: acyl-CoA dehydrogenase [Acidimicrobiales bacterium]|nr:acyl-CoA dehydrogenase [Acidimicrobiales bacterium]